MRRLVATCITLVLISGTASYAGEGDVCPCIPDALIWTVSRCETWTCSMARLIDGNGDGNLFSIPAGWGDRRWLVVRRVRSGSYVESPDNPYALESYDGLPAAIAMYGAIPPDRQPLLVTAPDGKVLLIALKKSGPKRRAAGR